jgi:hypothetical protein
MQHATCNMQHVAATATTTLYTNRVTALTTVARAAALRPTALPQRRCTPSDRTGPKAKLLNPPRESSRSRLTHCVVCAPLTHGVQQHSLQRSVTSLMVSCAYRRDGRKCLGKLLVDRVELLAVAAPAATCTPLTRASEGCSTRRAPCKARDAACAVQRAKCSVVACNVRRAAAVPHETIQQSNTIGVCYGAKNSTTTSFVASVTIDRTVAPTTTCACHVLHSCNYKPRWHPLEASRSPGGDVAAKARQITNDTCRLHWNWTRLRGHICAGTRPAPPRRRCGRSE